MAMPATTRRSLPLITNSELRSQRRCPMEHHLAYELGYRTLAHAEALRFGSLFHVGLDAWWRSGMQLSAAIDAMAPEAEDEFDFVRAGVLMQGYDARWQSDEYEILGVEVQFRTALINPETGAASRTFELAGKLDKLVRKRADGRVYIVEHKTTSEDIGVGSFYWKRLCLDSQISIYYAGARSLGHDVAGCIYDVIGKPRHAPLKATPEEARKYTKQGLLYANQRAQDETPDEFRQRLTDVICENPDRYFQRGDVVRLEREERDAAYDNWLTARAIRDAQLIGRYSRNTDSCMRYSRACDYFDVCSNTASLEDPTRFVRVDNVHQELAIDAA